MNADLHAEFKNNGFFEVKNDYVTKDFYQSIYADFDKIIAEAASNPAFKEDLLSIEKAFRETHYNKVFDGAPAGYRDCSSLDRKVDNKKYFQFNSEYYDFVKEKHSDILNKYSILKSFFDKLEYVSFVSKIMLADASESLRKTHPYITDAMYGDRKDLTVIIKVLSYDHNKKDLSTSPHYDKSALSLILNNDDKINNKLIISKFQDNFDFAKLLAPNRKFDDSGIYTSAILIPGALLQHVGISIQPTPHAVLESDNGDRHSIIAFALIPNIDVSRVETMIVNKNELNKKA